MNQKTYNYSKYFIKYFSGLCILSFLLIIQKYLFVGGHDFFRLHLTGPMILIIFTIVAFIDRTIYKYLGRERVEFDSKTIYIKIKTLSNKMICNEISINKIISIKRAALYDEYGVKIKYFDEDGDEIKKHITGLNGAYIFFKQLYDALERIHFPFDDKMKETRKRIEKIESSFKYEKEKRKKLRFFGVALYAIRNIMILYLVFLLASVGVMGGFDISEITRSFFYRISDVGAYIALVAISFFPNRKYPFDLNED